MRSILDGYCSLDEAAAVLGYHPGTLRRKLKAREIPGKQLSGGVWIVLKAHAENPRYRNGGQGRPAK